MASFLKIQTYEIAPLSCSTFHQGKVEREKKHSFFFGIEQMFIIFVLNI